VPKTDGSVRLPVRKMYKLFINGAFVRSESGRSDPLRENGVVANIARASRKDARDAVVAARAAQRAWWKTPPGTRGLVLYRLGEMLEARRDEFVERVRAGAGCNADVADAEVTAAVDRTIWYAGWCDKFAALLSTRNPVGGPHFNFSTPEPTGVVAVLAPDEPVLLGLVSVVLPPLVAGNAAVTVASESDPCTAVVFAEAVATSDLPAGAFNLLTGSRSEVAPVLAKHMDVNAIAYDSSESELAAQIESDAAENVKRMRPRPSRSRADWFSERTQSLDEIEAFSEIKTIWHPAGV
jgi:acyl-CoA reductase-like NAD-dependent aldehyde dehydrogenase